MDFNGDYVRGRVIYNDKYGLCMLFSYHPQYRSGKAEGFAVTDIPFSVFFTEDVWSTNTKSKIDTEDMKVVYKLLATYTDNKIVDYLAKLFADFSTKSIVIGNYGKYFVISARDIGIYVY